MMHHNQLKFTVKIHYHPFVFQFKAETKTTSSVCREKSWINYSVHYIYYISIYILDLELLPLTTIIYQYQEIPSRCYRDIAFMRMWWMEKRLKKRDKKDLWELSALNTKINQSSVEKSTVSFDHFKVLRRCLSERYVHLQDHDNVGLALEGVDTLDQFGVMEAVHDADLLPDVLLLLRWVRLDELSRPNLLGGFLH